MNFLVPVLICLLLAGSGILQVSSQCDPNKCVEEVQVQNIFLRPEDASGLPAPIICDQHNPTSFYALADCWKRQCGQDYGGNPTILNAIRTMSDICQGEARLKLTEAMIKCRIFYPSKLAPQLPPGLRDQCLTDAGRSRLGDLPATSAVGIEPRITNFFSEDPNDLSGGSVVLRPGYRPIAGTVVSENWDDSNWKWPSAVTSPNFPLVFPQSTLPFSAISSSQMGQQGLTMCLQVSDVMDCTLARSCGPDLGQIMKSLAMVYLGCSAIVRTSAVCDVNRVRYCMRVNGGNIFDVFDPARYSSYCQNYRAVLSCIDKDCPTNAAGNADLRLLEQYKLFLQKFCLDTAYQTSVVRASVNCPIFQGATVFPATALSMTCAQQLMQRQPLLPEPNLCTIVEANTYCLAQAGHCYFADVNPQKTAMLDMIGCNPAGVLQNDVVINLSNVINAGIPRHQTIFTASWICLLTATFVLLSSLG